jgi:hypothetical protein
MVYNTRDYWIFGLRPLSGIVENTLGSKILINKFSGLLISKVKGTYRIYIGE